MFHKLLRIVFIVHIVSDTDEFSTIIAASKENHSHTEDFGSGNALEVWGVGLEDELVDTDGDGSHQKGIEFLVILGAK